MDSDGTNWWLRPFPLFAHTLHLCLLCRMCIEQQAPSGAREQSESLNTVSLDLPNSGQPPAQEQNGQGLGQIFLAELPAAAWQC